MSTVAETSKLLACAKCKTNYPANEFSSQSTPICKKCKVPYFKCMYCRSMFNHSSKTASSATICPRCEQNVKSRGRPKACMYCRINAAFVENKCDRCAHSERKYGLPIICEQCKQKCAFKKKDAIEGEWIPLCWLCKLSYKRALDRTKKRKLEIPKMINGSGERASVSNVSFLRDPKEFNGKTITTEDQTGIITTLKERALLLEKQLAQKDAKLLQKEQELTKLQAEHFTKEQEMINAHNSKKRSFDKEMQSLTITIKTLQRELITLKKLKTGGKNGTNSPIVNNSTAS